MRALAAAALALATGALIACGGDRDASVTFPALDEQRSAEIGHPSFPVHSDGEGAKLCDLAQQSPPPAADGAQQIEFNVPDTGSDVTCMLP